MARKYFTEVREEKAVEFILNIKNLKEYMNAWLLICNNAREHNYMLYKVWNNSKNDIHVLTTPDNKAEIQSWLEQFGDLKSMETTAVFVDVSCDYDDFDKDYVDSVYLLGEID